MTSRLSATLFIAALAVGTIGVLGVKPPAARITLPLSWAVAVAAGFRSAYRVWQKENDEKLYIEAKRKELENKLTSKIDISIHNNGVSEDIDKQGCLRKECSLL